MATRRKPMSEINVVPYIDVMLVLLVIFMATAPLLTQGVQVDLPKAPSEPIDEAQNDPLVVSMRADGAIFLNLGMSRCGRRRHPGDGIFARRSGGQGAPGPPGGAGVCEGGSLVWTTARWSRVMTVLQKAGAESVGLITDPPDLGEAS